MAQPKPKVEATETSSVDEAEIRELLGREGVVMEDKKEGYESAVSRLVKGMMPSLPREEDMEKARKTPDYLDFMKKFEEEYGKGRPRPDEIASVTRKLDNRYKIMQEHSKEVERADCDLMLYRNKIVKDLSDVMNDLREAYNIINILIDDRNKLKDLFGIFNIQIKGLMAVQKGLEEDLVLRDKQIVKMKEQATSMQSEIDGLKRGIEKLTASLAEKSNECLVVKRQLSEAKSDIVKRDRLIEQQREEVERLRKEVEKLKIMLKTRTDELAKIRPEIPPLRDANKNLAINNDALKAENERLVKEVKRLIEDKDVYVPENATLKKDIKEIQTLLMKIHADYDELSINFKTLKVEYKDLKPDNEKLTKTIEDVNKSINELLDENKKLKAEPQELKDHYIPLVQDLTEKLKFTKEENDKLQHELMEVRAEYNEILDERKKRNGERRKRKEERMKKMVDDATKLMEDNVKKFNRQKNMLDSTDLVKSTIITQKDLDKYPMLETKQADVSHAVLEEAVPEYHYGDIPPVDRALLEAPIEMHGKPPGGSVSVTKGSQFFEVREPFTSERAPFKRIASEIETPFYSETFEEPLDINDPDCPYCLGPYQYPATTTELFSESMTREALIANAREFLLRANSDPRFRSMFATHFPGMDIDEIIRKEDYYDFALKLMELMRKKKPIVVESKPKPMSDEDLKKLVDIKLRNKYRIESVKGGNLKVRLDVAEEVIVIVSKYEEVLIIVVKMVRPDVDARGKDQAVTEVVSGSVDAKNKEICELFRKRQWIAPKPAPPPPPPPPEKKEDDTPILTPTSAEKGGLMPKILQLIKSKQKEGASMFRRIEPGTGKVIWIKTHFIFIIDCSGSMTGKRWKCVIEGYDRCLGMLKGSEAIVSTFTFDDKCTDYVKEIEIAAHGKIKSKMPFSHGEKTDYMAAMSKCIKVITTDLSEKYKDWLSVIIFLSDGKGGYPEDEMNALVKMKKDEGRKMLFTTFACETEEDDDMRKMATIMEGDHYKVTDAEAMRGAFMKIVASQKDQENLF